MTEVPARFAKVAMIPPEGIAAYWHNVRGMLSPAIDRSHGRWSLEHLYYILMTGQQQLWVAYNPEGGDILGTMTTQIVTYPHNKMLAFQFLGGAEFDDWFHELSDMTEKFARDNHCAGVEGTARFGFWPRLKSAGYDKSYAVYEKILGVDDDE
tara:strand:- start:30400 stop:30858 length:459 start_codon:yes stop_codon:yes gene_type:complete